MRADFNKLLCERERPRSSDGFANYRNMKRFDFGEVDEVGGKQSMKSRFGDYPKSFNENLSPLRGWIRSKVGKRWDESYSELCGTFDKRKVINQHIIQHLFEYVEMNVVVQDGQLMTLTRYRGSRGYVPITESFADYFVDPRDGILKVNKKKSRRTIQLERQKRMEQENSRFFRVIDAKTHLIFDKGVWYELTVDVMPLSRVEYVRPPLQEWFEIKRYGRTPVMKRWDDLNEIERRRYGLRVYTGLVTDVVTGPVARTKPVPYGEPFAPFSISNQARILQHQFKYYSAKKTASHKVLKRAGVDGTAPGPVKKRSHRTLATYR